MWLQAKSRVMLSHPFLYLEPGPASVCRMESGRIHTWLPGAQRPKGTKVKQPPKKGFPCQSEQCRQVGRGAS